MLKGNLHAEKNILLKKSDKEIENIQYIIHKNMY